MAAYRQCLALAPAPGRRLLEPGQSEGRRPDRRRRSRHAAALSRRRPRCRRPAAPALCAGQGAGGPRRAGRRLRALRPGRGAAAAPAPYDADELTAQVPPRQGALLRGLLRRAGRLPAASSAAPIFIVGLPRSGSTLIEQILASHSQVEGTMELPEHRLDRRAASAPDYPEAVRRPGCGANSPRSATATSRATRIHRKLGRAALHRQDAQQLPAPRPDPADPAERAGSSTPAAIRWDPASPPSSSTSPRARPSPTTWPTSAATTATMSS